MTITQDTGVITLPEVGASIASTLSRSEFLQVPEFSGASIFVQSEPWCSYRLPAIRQKYTDLVVIVQFRGEELFSLDLCHSAACFGTSWENWSEERELARKAFHERWLASEVGVRPGKYAWGEISSYYDEKGRFSSIVIRYARAVNGTEARLA